MQTLYWNGLSPNRSAIGAWSDGKHEKRVILVVCSSSVWTVHSSDILQFEVIRYDSYTNQEFAIISSHV